MILITTREAARLLGVSASAALQIMKGPDCQEGTRGKSQNFYSRKRVEAKAEEVSRDMTMRCFGIF